MRRMRRGRQREEIRPDRREGPHHLKAMRRGLRPPHRPKTAPDTRRRFLA